ncbi:hypothetical protein GCM10010401_09080 [Rarobacter faecitabidus]|uniref:Fibronectin type III domain protein n=1 Tax=Rarobacter faecitabidus TaxID=13243 RepID=A0A542ZAZ4_RARFA|nr:fibronectin type III domain-containing protein [Rarobacter faecitabidus]TQL57508.1 fibronectin type III domain protein [Rarobacter faecitabidus]
MGLHRRASITTLSTAVVSALAVTIAMAPAAQADTLSYNAYADFSCSGTTGKISRAKAYAIPPTYPETNEWLYDAGSGQGLAPSAWNPTFLAAWQVRWDDRVIESDDDLVMNGQSLTAAQKKQIAFIVNRWGIFADSSSQFYAVRRAIDKITGATTGACTTSNYDQLATNMINQVSTLIGSETGKVTITPTIGDFDPATRSFTLTDIAVRDKGSGIDYAEMDSHEALTIDATITGASFRPQPGYTTREISINAGVIEAVKVYATQPGDVELTLTYNRMPSLDLRVLEGSHMARQIIATRSVPATTTTGLVAPKDIGTLNASNITATTATIASSPLLPWIDGQDTATVALTSPDGPSSRIMTLAQASTQTFTGLTPSTTYNARLTRADGFASPATTTFTTGPVAPTGLRVTSTSTSAAVSWNPTPGATSYRVTVGTLERTVTATSTQITGLTPKTSYPVSVQSIGDNPGAIATSAIRTPLAPPTATRATNTTATTATLTWGAVPGAVTYLIRVDGMTSTWTSTSTTATLTGLTPGRTYTATIAATAPGEAISQATATFATTPNTPPAVKITKRTPTTLTLSWTRGPAGSRYEIRVTGKSGKTVTTPSTSTTITGLTAASAYTVSVRTLVGSSSSPWQTPVTTSTTAKATPTVGIKKTKKARKISITNAAPGTKICVEVLKGKKWRRAKTVTATNKGTANLTVTTRNKVRVIVPASPSTRKVVRSK